MCHPPRADRGSAGEIIELGPWFHNLHLPDGSQTAADDPLGDFPATKWAQVCAVAQAVNYLAGQAEVSRQSGGAVAGEILDAWVAGAGLGELEDPAAAYRAVTAEDVLRVAAASLDPLRRAEGVVRGTGAAASPVAALQS